MPTPEEEELLKTPGMFNPNPAPPGRPGQPGQPGYTQEQLNAMLGLSGSALEQKKLADQLAMAKQLGASAVEFNPAIGRGNTRGAAIGGALGALSKGLQGYMAGKDMKAGREGLTALNEREKGYRGTYYRGLPGINHPQMPTAPGRAPDMPPEQEMGY